MSKRPALELRRERERVIGPLFTYMVGRGMRRAWLAGHLGISTALLWNYEHGLTRLPPDFVERACQIVGIPASMVSIPEPRERYIQQPRIKRANAKRSAKPSTGGSDITPRRGRRSQRTSSSSLASKTGADDLPPGRMSRRVARQPHGNLTVMTDLDVMSSSLSNDL